MLVMAEGGGRGRTRGQEAGEMRTVSREGERLLPCLSARSRAPLVVPGDPADLHEILTLLGEALGASQAAGVEGIPSWTAPAPPPRRNPGAGPGPGVGSAVAADGGAPVHSAYAGGAAPLCGQPPGHPPGQPTGQLPGENSGQPSGQPPGHDMPRVSAI